MARGNKAKIMNAVDLFAAFASPSTEHAEVLISYGLNFMDSRWFHTAVPAFVASKQEGLTEDVSAKLNKQYDPWPYFKEFLEQYQAYAHNYLDVWWDYIEEVVTDPYRLLDILNRKPENAKYLSEPNGFQYIQFISKQLYDKIYDWNWPEEETE